MPWKIILFASLISTLSLATDGSGRRTKRYVKEEIPFLAENFRGPRPGLGTNPIPGLSRPGLFNNQPPIQISVTTSNKRPSGPFNNKKLTSMPKSSPNTGLIYPQVPSGFVHRPSFSSDSDQFQYQGFPSGSSFILDSDIENF